MVIYLIILKYIGYILAGIVWLIGVSSGIVTWLSSWQQARDNLYKMTNITGTDVASFIDTKMSIIFLTSIVLSLLILYGIFRTRILVVAKSIFRRPLEMATHIHQFEHLYDDIINEIDIRKKSGETVNLGSHVSRESVFKLLEQIRVTLASFGDENTNINIKIPINNSGSHGWMTDPKKFKLVTYERAPSPYEFKKTAKSDKSEKRELKRRSNNEKFLIMIDDDDDISSIDKNNGKCHSRSGIRCNSAYNSVLGSGRHAWISNDIVKMKKKGLYKSTSDKWEDYYKSLAVVAIAPHQAKEDGYVENSFGILVADSIGKGAFNRTLTKKLMGYYAHRLYRLLSYIEIN